MIFGFGSKLEAEPAVASRAVRRAALAFAVLLALAVASALGFAHVYDVAAPERIDRAAPAPRSPAPRRVLLISIDGLAPRVLARVAAPTLERLAREGVAARDARTVEPSITLPSHTSMLSGVPVATHGVLWNRYQPWSEITWPTVFHVCAVRRLACGLFAGKRKFAHFAEPEPGVERYVFGASAGAVLDAAAAYLRERDPDFVMIHLAEVDLVGHASGWDSREQRAVIASLDAQLGRFLAGAEALGGRPLTVIVTADHGGEGRNHAAPRPENRTIPWIAWGDGVSPGTRLEDVSIADTAPTVLALLGQPDALDVPSRALLP